MSQTTPNPLAEPTSASTNAGDKTAKILERWSELELLLERSGRQDKLVSELENYVGDLRSEAGLAGKMRVIMVGAALAYVVFINSLMVCMLFYHKLFLLILGDYGRVALIVGAISSTVVLIAKTLVGLFRTHGDRNKDDVLPPHVRELMEAYGAIKQE